jgi:hypothetical protein
MASSMAGRSRPKDGVASLAYAPAISLFGTLSPDGNPVLNAPKLWLCRYTLASIDMAGQVCLSAAEPRRLRCAPSQ